MLVLHYNVGIYTRHVLKSNICPILKQFKCNNFIFIIHVVLLNQDSVLFHNIIIYNIQPLQP